MLLSGSSSEDDKGRIDDENSDAGEFDDIIGGLGASASSSSDKKTGASNADFQQAFLSSGNNSGLGPSAVNGNKSSSRTHGRCKLLQKVGRPWNRLRDRR